MTVDKDIEEYKDKAFSLCRSRGEDPNEIIQEECFSLLGVMKIARWVDYAERLRDTEKHEFSLKEFILSEFKRLDDEERRREEAK